jgi:hypothetical protein
MRNLLMGMRILIIVALASSAVAFAQNGQRKPFNPHDLSGFWDLTNIGLPRGALNETSNNRPQMTQWGLEKFRKTKTGDANALTNGAYPNEKDWNDPIRWCDPTGFPRIMWNPTPAGMRFAQTNEEVIQFFQNNRVWRDIWTDGRKLPDADADTSWLDQYGSPHSDEMTVEERYRRVDHAHLEMTLNITDPKAYVGTWKGDKKIFQLAEKSTRSVYNDFPEDICVWSETKRPVLK